MHIRGAVEVRAHKLLTVSLLCDLLRISFKWVVDLRCIISDMTDVLARNLHINNADIRGRRHVYA